MAEQGSVVRFGNCNRTVLHSAQALRVVQLCGEATVMRQTEMVVTGRT